MFMLRCQAEGCKLLDLGQELCNVAACLLAWVCKSTKVERGLVVLDAVEPLHADF